MNIIWNGSVRYDRCFNLLKTFCEKLYHNDDDKISINATDIIMEMIKKTSVNFLSNIFKSSDL